METLIIILIFVFFCCGPFYMLICSGLDKAKEKGYDGCIMLIIILLGVILTLCGLFNTCKSCLTDSHSHDYYESPRK